MVNDLSAILQALTFNPNSLKKAHKLLLLERLSMEERPTRGMSRLEADDIREVLARMAWIDVAMSLTPQEAASLLRESVADIQEDIAAGRLHAVKGGGRDVLPSWQFTIAADGKSAAPITRRMEVIVAAIPADVPAGFVRAVMTLDDPSLPVRAREHMSPREFLIDGGNPMPVATTLLRYLEGSSDRLLEIWNSG